jgi:hypothetical protein
VDIRATKGGDRLWRRVGLLLLLGLMIGAVAAVTGSAATSNSPDPTEIAPPGPEGNVVDRQIPGNQSGSHVPATLAPRPTPLTVGNPGSNLGVNFSGINFHNERRDTDGGNQLSVEPPDQGLCVGNGRLIEAVNDTIAIYNESTGSMASGGGFESLNQFFTNDHAIDRDHGNTFGTFTSDPRCLYDADNGGHFFMTITSFARDPISGAFEAPGNLLLAVSKTNSPTTSPSDWNFTTIDVTNDGTAGTDRHPSCPCFGDQPLIGTDANGFYITTNEFPINGPGFNGAQIYALQKSALEAGRTPNIVRIEGAPIPFGSDYVNGIPYSLQPATSPSTSDFETANDGTEYLLGALEFGKKPFQFDNRIAVWAITNTASLNSRPHIHVSDKVISSEVYGLPGAITQPNGPIPLGDSLKNHENLIDGGDDRMQAAVFAHGVLWGASDTTVKTPSGASQVGTAYYLVSPTFTGTATQGNVGGSVIKQGYLSVDKASVTRPSLGVTSSGKAVIGVSLIGGPYYPSAAYATLSDSLTESGPTELTLAQAGPVPADGFSGYAGEGSPTPGLERWGDYGFAAVDGGHVWVANEYVAGLDTAFGTPDLANWYTYLSEVTP